VGRLRVKRKLSVAISLGLALLSLTLAARMFIDRGVPPLRISAGPAGTRRHAVAEMLARHAARNGLSISLSTNAGAEESLRRLNSGQLDVALVSNGVTVPHDDDLTVLAVTQVEAVHLLLRAEIASAPSVIEGIRGKRVNLGQPGSSEALLSREILKFARLRVRSPQQAGDIVATEFGKPELQAKCQAILAASGDEREQLIRDLPDALILLDAPPSSVARQLIEAADYRLSPLPATNAFLLENLQESSNQSTVLQREFLEPATIPKHSYFGQRALPEVDCETVGIRLLLVTRKNAPAAAIKSLMTTLFESELTHRLNPLSPREVANPYPIHEAAIAYLDRDKPVAVDKVLESLSNGLSVFGAFAAGVLSLYGLLRTRTARQPSDYYDSIRKIEELARTLDQDPATAATACELLDDLDERLSKLRQNLIEDICEGRIKGEQLIANILALLNDVRGGLQIRIQELPRVDAQSARSPGRLSAKSTRSAA